MRIGEPCTAASCITHLPGDKNLPILWSFVQETGDHAAACVMGYMLGCYLRQELYSLTFSIDDLVEGMLGMYKRSSARSAARRLEVMGFLEKVTRSPYIIKQLLVRDLPAPSEPHCPWCKSPTRRTHDHHWPLTRQEGGTETVAICHPCHVDYHAIARRETYAPTEKAFALLRSSGVTLEMIQ